MGIRQLSDCSINLRDLVLSLADLQLERNCTYEN